MTEKKDKKETNEKEETKTLEVADKEEIIKKENKQLRNIFIVIGIVVGLFFLSVFIIDSIRNFEYQGVKYTTIKEGKLIFYQTSFPIYSTITGNHVADYNAYFRNDPRNLRDISFDGALNRRSTMVLNFTGNPEEFNCDGDGGIAIANLAQVYKSIGTEVIKDPKAGCDPKGNYMFVQIKAGNQTEIKQTGISCYDLYVNNCEILKVTERFMNEAMVQINTKPNII
jgi:hypothetical protein